MSQLASPLPEVACFVGRSFSPSNFWLRILLCALCIAATPSWAAVQARGLVVVNDGTTSREYSAAAEFAQISITGATFRAELTSGGEFSGLAGHIVALISYDTKSEAELKKMEAAVAGYRKAAPLLKPRIESLKAYLANPPPVEAAPEAAPTIPEMRCGTEVYKNVVPMSLRDGVLGFRHNSGAFRAPATVFPQRELMELPKYNSNLQANADFQRLLSFFVPKLTVKGKAHTGVRILSQSESELVLQTDEGIVRSTPTEVDPSAKKQLTEARSRQDAFLTELQVKRDAAIKKEEERIAKLDEAKRDAARQAAEIQRAKLESEAQMWNATAQMIGGFFSQPKVYYVQ